MQRTAITLGVAGIALSAAACNSDIQPLQLVPIQPSGVNIARSLDRITRYLDARTNCADLIKLVTETLKLKEPKSAFSPTVFYRVPRDTGVKWHNGIAYFPITWNEDIPGSPYIISAVIAPYDITGKDYVELSPRPPTVYVEGGRMMCAMSWMHNFTSPMDITSKFDIQLFKVNDNAQ